MQEKTAKARREFYIPRRNREKALHGSEFEIRLRNDFSQKAISRECADWIRRKVCFKSNQTAEGIPNFMTIDSAAPVTYAPVNGFTRADLGCERGSNLFTMINRIDAPQSTQYLELFNTIWNDKQRLQDVTDTVLESITTAYQENSPEFLYFFALYNIFGDFLEHVSEDDLPSDTNGGMITIDGTPINELKRENIHNLFGMVLQDTWMFEGTLRENLVYSKTDVTDKQLDEVCAAAGLTSLVKRLPDGYDTVLGDNASLSAG